VKLKLRNCNLQSYFMGAKLRSVALTSTVEDVC
jgi:hypothetical protein